jgi:hypothetical protein
MINGLCYLQQNFDGTLPTLLNQARLAKQLDLRYRAMFPNAH